MLQPQQPEINDQFKATELVTEKPGQAVSLDDQPTKQELVPPESIVVPETTAKTTTEDIVTAKENDTRVAIPDVGFTVRIYKFISEPIIKVVNTPKVNEVLRNIGTCVVNGAMELFSYYLPAPFMPLLASAAGLVIPFEPVVMLKERMPVTSYKRAFQTAMSTFLRTFDKYKVADDFDPYMTRRFNRRFMNDDHDHKEGKIPEHEDVQ